MAPKQRIVGTFSNVLLHAHVDLGNAIFECWIIPVAFGGLHTALQNPQSISAIRRAAMVMAHATFLPGA